jgi:hypothetical protein
VEWRAQKEREKERERERERERKGGKKMREKRRGVCERAVNEEKKEREESLRGCY